MKQEEKREKSLNYILQAAIEIFAEKESNDISINQLCIRNGISKGKLYHYFKSKEDLYFYCCDYAFSRLTADINAFVVNPDCSIEENFRRYYERRINYWAEHISEFILFYDAILKFNMQEDERLSQRRLIHKVTRKEKWKKIFLCSSQHLNISDDDLHEILKTLYDNLFIQYMNKFVLAVKCGDEITAQYYKDYLLKLNDKVIQVILYGVIEKEKSPIS